MFTFQGVQLTEDQFNLLSWLATVNKGVNMETTSDWKLGMRAGVQSACTFAGIPDKLVYAVHIDHIYSKLRNYDRISAIEYFD